MTAEAFVSINRRYVLIDELGVGGMGTVYRAKDRLSGDTVALKQLHTHAERVHTASRTTSVMLANEFKFLASLRHPHIISVLDYGFDGEGKPFYTMTLLERALDLVTVAAKLDLDGKVELLIKVLQALVYLHRRGILHRDLKPSNVLVDAEGQLKVVDFGVAALADEATTPGGTVLYMPPELINGMGAVPQSDLYAVGVMAYELFAGERPFEASHPVALMIKVLREPPDLAKLTIDPGLIAIIARLLAKLPEERYPTAEAVIQAFSEALGRPLVIETPATRESFLQAARFVGRRNELDRLIDSFNNASDGQGSVWLVGGESGVGKSRLMDEVQTHALIKGALVLRGQAVAEGGAPYQIWRDAIRRLALQTELTDLEATILKALIPDIERLLDRQVQDSPEIDVQSLQARLFGVIESMFQRQHEPVVLLLEDVQWADDSLALLKRLHVLAGTSKLLIIGSYRYDERPTLHDEFPELHHIKLERLSTSSIEMLSVSMLGDVGKSQALVDLLQRETEGNVFFIVEVVRALAEDAGQLAEVGRKTLPHHVLAGGIKTVLQRRLDKVPESARRLLKVAAVAGRELDLSVLHSIMPELDMEAWLQQVATVLDVISDRYRFAHDKLREGLLDALEPTERKQIHGALARAIESAYPDAAEQYPVLAHHWAQAQDNAKTIQYSILAGKEALRAGSYREAIQLFKTANALTDPSKADTLQLATLYHLLGTANWGQSELVEAKEWNAKALRLLGYSVPGAPRQQLAAIIKPLIRHLWRRLVNNTRQYPDNERLFTVVQAFDQMVRVSYHESNVSLGMYSIMNAIDAAERAGNSIEAIRMQSRLYALLSYGLEDVSLHRFSRMYLKLAETRLNVAPDPETQATFNLTVALQKVAQGHWSEANQLMDEAARFSEAAGNVRASVEVGTLQVCAVVLQGRFADALESVTAMMHIAKRDEQVHFTGMLLVLTSKLLLLQGKAEESREFYTQNEPSIDAALNMGHHTLTPSYARGFLTDLYTQTETWDQALKYGKELETLLDESQAVSFSLAGEAAAPARLYLTLWERKGDKAYARLAENALKRFQRKYTRHYPIGKPIELVYRCWYTWLNGDAAHAQALGAQAIEAAQAYKMPYYEALAHSMLGRFMRSETHLEKSRALFEAIGLPNPAP